MTFEEAVRLVEKASQHAARLTFEEGMQINAACAIVALEYIKVRDRIMPA